MYTDTKSKPRAISRELAPLVEFLELERPSLVTLKSLKEMAEQLGLRTTPRKAVETLKRTGWLLSSGIDGVYEFAPADRAGPISEGDSLLALRAAVTKVPNLRVAAALTTALFMLNIADRKPEVSEIAFARTAERDKVPIGIRRKYRVLNFDWKLPTINIGGTPVHRAATVLAHAVERPNHVRNWATLLELLPSVIAASSMNELRTEMDWRSHATKVRLAYLTHSISPEIAEGIGVSPAGKVWFGPRAKLRRHNAQWNVADTILPFAPSELAGHVNNGSLDQYGG